jgi:membrane protease YdiL (CAAX protease family)
MDLQYKQEVQKFGKKDGIIALCAFLACVIITMAFVALRRMFPLSLSMNALFSILVYSLQAGIVFAIVIRNKQGLTSIGVHKEKIWPAIRLGLLVSLIPILFSAILPRILGVTYELLIGTLLLMLVVLIFSAVCEDVIFVGFIQTRLYGFFKTDRVAIVVGALIFSLWHVPPFIIMNAGYLTPHILFAELTSGFLYWFSMHFVLVSVFKKHYSLVPVSILHTITNFSSQLSERYNIYGINFQFVTTALLLIVACILFWHTHKQAKKVTTE